MSRSNMVLLRDLLIFQIKLLLDGVKDVALSPIAVGAVVLDMVAPGPRAGHRFYAVMALGEKFDGWLNLFGAADRASAETDGLFGASRAGSNSMLGSLEKMVLGHDEPRERARRSA
jgi:hypothetical protein